MSKRGKNGLSNQAEASLDPSLIGVALPGVIWKKLEEFIPVVFSPISIPSL